MLALTVKKQVKHWLLLTLTALLTACASILTDEVVYQPAMPIDVPPPPQTRGTIYQAGYNVNLYEDRVARRVGDVLTVRLEEATQGVYSAKTKTNRNAQLDYPLPIFFGKPTVGAIVETNTNQIFDSKGDSNQSNKLDGTISVTVTRVLSNHNLVIQGESWVSINQGHEYVQLTGVVRPEDITPLNTVSSQRIAGAQIKYGARGQAGQATSMGLATNLFNKYAPY
jgi:flagellar L-ring protein precursor FlgH